MPRKAPSPQPYGVLGALGAGGGGALGLNWVVFCFFLPLCFLPLWLWVGALPHSSPEQLGRVRGAPGSPSLPPTAGQRGTIRKNPSWLPLLGTCTGSCGTGLGGMQLLGGPDPRALTVLSPGWEPHCSGHAGCMAMHALLRGGGTRTSPAWGHTQCHPCPCGPSGCGTARWHSRKKDAEQGGAQQGGHPPLRSQMCAGHPGCPHAVLKPCCAPTFCIPRLCTAVSAHSQAVLHLLLPQCHHHRSSTLSTSPPIPRPCPLVGTALLDLPPLLPAGPCWATGATHSLPRQKFFEQIKEKPHAPAQPCPALSRAIFRAGVD